MTSTYPEQELRAQRKNSSFNGSRKKRFLTCAVQTRHPEASLAVPMRKTKILVVLIFVVVLASIVFGVIWWNRQNPSPPSISSQPAASPSPTTPSLPASPSPIALESPSPTIAPSVSPSPTPLDVNDVSFLWPVPQTKADVDALVSLNDAAADGKIFPADLFAKLIEEAKTVSVGSAQISFPSDAEFKNPANWKVAGIRVNPSALGSNPLALMQGGIIPSIRLIVQPVTVNGDKFEIHDFTAHVVFLQIFPHPDKTKPFQPDNEAFNAVVKDLRGIKAFLAAAGVTTANQELNVHPGFRFAGGKRNEVPGFSEKVRALLRTHLSSKRLGVISFMGIPGQFEPWIFFKVTVANGNLTREEVSGNFLISGQAKQPMSQMISNQTGSLAAEPAPVPDANALFKGFGVGTALLFRPDVAGHLDDDLFPGATNELARKLKLRHVADFIANPTFRNTGNTDCVSCHTETTQRRSVAGLVAPEGIAFKHPAGISKVAEAVLPKDKWNVRDFGWGFNFFVDKGFRATITQRAANEAAESADLINKESLAAPVPQPVTVITTQQDALEH